MSYLTTWQIREIEGAARWSAVLSGRALPLRESNPVFGITSRQEDSFLRGQREGRTEPMGVSFPDLAIAGHWKYAFFVTGDARAKLTPGGTKVQTPQQLCDFFETFVGRQKVVEVTFSGGVVRVCRWDEFTHEPTRGLDRKWTMKWKVLGRGDSPEAAPYSPLTASDAQAALAKAQRDLDLALSGEHPQHSLNTVEPTFLEQLQEVVGKAREAVGALRLGIQGAGDFARAPADAWRQINALALTARDTLLSVRDEMDATALEYQTQYATSGTILQAVTWGQDVRAGVDYNLDAVFRLLLEAERKAGAPARYVSCLPGQSLVRVAIDQYGPGQGGAWMKIADANGITGQTVPSGITRLLIPE